MICGQSFFPIFDVHKWRSTQHSTIISYEDSIVQQILTLLFCNEQALSTLLQYANVFTYCSSLNMRIGSSQTCSVIVTILIASKYKYVHVVSSLAPFCIILTTATMPIERKCITICLS